MVARLEMFTLVILAGLVLSVAGAKCPQPEFVYPCECRPWETGIFVVCHQVNNTNRLKTVFQVLRDYEITRMLLKDCHLTDSSPSIFAGMNIKLLRLMDSSITRTDGSRRPGPVSVLAPYIDRLDVTNCGGLLTVQELSLGPLGKLKDLNVVRDNIGTLRKSHMPNPSNVTNLKLEHCEISTIEPGALSHMTSLRSLALQNNRLMVLTRDILPQNCANLLSIDLSENKISNLPANFFEGMTSLHTVSLYRNEIQTLVQNTWRPIWSRLDKLWLNGNNITCDTSVEWICEEDRRPPTLYGYCTNPEQLRGVNLATLSHEQLSNRHI